MRLCAPQLRWRSHVAAAPPAQVPANRLGHVSYGGPFSAPQLKVIQELLSLTAFAIFSTAVLKEKLRWTDGAGFLLILAGVAVAMAGREIAARREGGAQRAYEQLEPPPPPPPGGDLELAHAPAG